MQMPGFIFGGNTGLTPADLKKRNAIASAMMKRTRAPQNKGEGLDAASRQIVGALLARQAEKQNKAAAGQAKVDANAEIYGSGDADSSFYDFIGGGGGGAPSGGGYPEYSSSGGAPAPEPGAAYFDEATRAGRPDPGFGFGDVGGNPMMPGQGLDMGQAGGGDTVTGSQGQDDILMGGGGSPMLPGGQRQPAPPSPELAFSPEMLQRPFGGGADRAPQANGSGNSLAQGIIDTAKAIGADPLDLATVISYETAGTFDPTKRGPTTQWGQHRGLIQFGEPQARRFGVDWNDPVNSQLGPDGAVAKYLTSSGYKPGMGLLDLYSTINAGAPGLYNRSDANNGGAPGTVADKVRDQMAGHRRKAMELLGGGGRDPIIGSQGNDRMAAPRQAIPGFQPRYAGIGFGPQGAAPSPQPAVARGQQPQPTQAQFQQQQGGGVNLPELPPEMIPRRSSRELLQYWQQNGQRLSKPAQEAFKRELQRAQMYEDPYGRLEMRQRYAELSGWKPQAGPSWEIKELSDGFNYYVDMTGQQPPRRVNPDIAAPQGGAEGTEFGLNPQYGVDANGNPVILQLGKDGTATQTVLPDGVTFQKEPVRIDAGTHITLLDPISRIPIGQIPKNNEEAAAQTARGTAAGRSEAESTAAAPQVIAGATETINLIDSVMNDPMLASITGKFQGRLNPESAGGLLMGQNQIDLAIKVQQLQGKAFMEAFETLKGGGQITEKEGQAAQNAIARLQRVQSDEAYRAALQELRDIADRGRQRALQRTGGAPAQSGQPPSAPASPQGQPSAGGGAPDFAQMDAASIQDFMAQNPPSSLDAATKDALRRRLLELKGSR